MIVEPGGCSSSGESDAEMMACASHTGGTRAYADQTSLDEARIDFPTTMGRSYVPRDSLRMRW